MREVREPLRWYRDMAERVHEQGEAIETLPTLDDDGGAMGEVSDGDCFGSVATVTRHFEELRALGLRKVIGWFHFGNMPHANVRRSMEIAASELISL